GELRVFGKEPIAGMNRIDLRLARDPQNVRDVQISLDRAAMTADEVRFIGLGPVQRKAILLRVDRYRRQTQLARGAHDSNRDLAAIGNQESLYPPRHDRKALKIVEGSDHTGSCAPEWRFRRTRMTLHALAIHGGAGPIPAQALTPERDRDFRAALRLALDAGYQVLETGGTSLDAVTTAVRILENDPLFNAGRGAALTRDG